MPKVRRALALLALLACAGALAASAAAASAGAGHHGHSRQAHRHVAAAAAARLASGQAYRGIRLDPASLVRVTVCFHGACASRNVRPEPTCDPQAGVCLGTALRAWRPDRFTTVEAESA